MAGRPKHWFTIDLDNIDDTVDEILKACKTPKVREGFQNLIIRLKDSLFEKSNSQIVIHKQMRSTISSSLKC